MKKALFTTFAVLFTSTMVMADDFDKSSDPCSTGDASSSSSTTADSSKTVDAKDLLNGKK